MPTNPTVCEAIEHNSQSLPVKGHPDMERFERPDHHVDPHMPAPPHPARPHPGPGHHIPPHERRSQLPITYSEEDWAVMCDVFGDEDTAIAAAEALREGPPEVRVLALQLLNLIKEGN